jgi:large subunit ribosomal protein L4
MAKLPVYDRTGNQVATYDIEPKDLAPHINRQLLHDAVVMYERNLRQGSAKTKARSEVAGTTKKMYRQKGTGNARAGSRRTNIRRGGGHAKQKRPRDWSYRLPRKALQAATRMALAAKIRDEEVVVIDQLSFAAPKTKEMAGILTALKLGGVSVLVATETHDLNLWKSARNIDKVSVSPVGDLNALCVLRPRRLLVTRAALDQLKQRQPSQRTAKGAASA